MYDTIFQQIKPYAETHYSTTATFFWQKAYVKIFQTSYERDFTTKKWIIIFGSHLINIFGTTCPDVIEIVVN